MATRKITDASFVCWVEASIASEELINDLKVYTWNTKCEHAVLELRGTQRRAIVRGGTHGVRFKLRDSALIDWLGYQAQYASINIEGQPIRIDKLIMHTHPEPTGPSEGDFEMLEILDQDASMIYEINGPVEGTKFKRRSKSQPRGEHDRKSER